MHTVLLVTMSQNTSSYTFQGSLASEARNM